MTDVEIAPETLRHLLVQAESDAAGALQQSTDALIAWGDAMAAFRNGSGSAKAAVDAEERFNKALAARLMADAKLEYLRKRARPQPAAARDGIEKDDGFMPKPDVDHLAIAEANAASIEPWDPSFDDPVPGDPAEGSR